MVPPGKDHLNPDTNAIQPLVAVRDGDDRRIAQFHNTPARYDDRPEESRAHTAELEPLVGTGTVVS